jgi:hypothetical protein
LAVADLAQKALTIPLTGLDNDGIRQVREHLLPTDERRVLYARIVRAADAPELAAWLLPAQLAWLATQAVPAIEAGLDEP